MKKQFVALILRSLFTLLLACTLVSAEEATENAPDAPQLQKLKHLVLSPTSEEVILQLNGSYSPKVFTLKDENPRIIFDFAGMTYGRGVKGVTTTSGSIVKRVRVGMHEGDPPKTRIVFDVSTFKGLNFTQKFDASNSTLVVQFTGPGKAAPPRHQDKAVAPAPAKEAATAAAATGPVAAAAPPEQAAAPQPIQDELEKAAVQPTLPEPPQPPAQPAPAPAKETAAAPSKQPQPEKAEVPAPAPAKPTAKKESTKPEEKKDAQPEASAMKPEQTGAAGREASPPPETAVAPPAPAPVKPEEPEKKPEKPAKEAATQPAPESKKEKKAKAAAQSQEAAAPPAAAADKKAGEGAPEAGKPEAADKPAILANATDKPQIEYVKFDDSSPKGEMVMFKLNGFHPPAIHGVEEGIPRVICDFSNTKLLQKSKGPIKTNGKFIKVIRTTTTKKPEKVRVVIDLEPNRSYDLQQVFFKEDNLFVLIVNTAKK
ncbi:AMIN domain-containing protein [Desulfobulbus sp.]|uniref:AMIN domain-containing protein n=1 Tax=Desulfobulbus sp. TaxID=895 RepID=UPI00286ED113|nr:AMIN domain-containing protein [Desulfobulbus sp.]